MGPFSAVVSMLESLGGFSFLALLLVFVLLYFLFMRLLSDKVKRIKKESWRKLISVISSGAVTAALFLTVFGAAGTVASYVAVIVLILAFFLVTVIALSKIMGIDLASLIVKSK